MYVNISNNKIDEPLLNSDAGLSIFQWIGKGCWILTLFL